MDQVLLPTTWAYPDKTILQIIQARTKQQPQQPKNATKRWKLLEAENSATVATSTPSMRRARTSLFYGRPWKRQTLHGYLPVPWLLSDMGRRSWVNPGKLVGMLGISERVPLALENVGDAKNDSQTCAVEIDCQDSSNPNSRAVVKSLTRFTTFHLKQSCACRACTLNTAILALQFNASSIWVTIWFDCASYFGWSRPVHAKPALWGMKTNARSPDRTAGAVNGAVRTDEEEDTLSKARKAAKVHLNALKEHVDKVPVMGGAVKVSNRRI